MVAEQIRRKEVVMDLALQIKEKTIKVLNANGWEDLAKKAQKNAVGEVVEFRQSPETAKKAASKIKDSGVQVVEDFV